MFKIQTLNKISPDGLSIFSRNDYEIASEINNPDAVLVRSSDMHSLELPVTLKVIARAGAGVNNIPIDKCTDKGIVVFNTPGANANAVKELVVCSLFLASRKIVDGIIWAKSLIGKGEEVPNLIEKGKTNYAGPEIKGKKLGVIGLGAIGVMVANDAINLGMEVTGFDPFISIESAWGLSSKVKRSEVLEQLISDSDYITIHVPLIDKTKNLINKNRFDLMKKGTKLINFSRNGLVNNKDLKEAIKSGIINCYITDFPDEDLLKIDQIISIPHLGASTPESEDNCALMAANQIKNFLEHGVIKNSVNFPETYMPPSTTHRIIIANKNVPNMIGQITEVLATKKVNISDMINKHCGEIAYNIIDTDSTIEDDQIEAIKKIDGVVMVRIVC